MNNAGQIPVGHFRASSFLYTPGSSGGLVDLGSLGGGNTFATALNAIGEVVGRSNTAGGADRLSSTGMAACRAWACPARPSRRHVTSTIAAKSSCFPSARTHLSRRHLPSGRPPHRSERPRGLGFPRGINNRGQVFGTWTTPDATSGRTFFYDNGRMVDIGTLGGGHAQADMNGSGQIVGSSNGSVPSSTAMAG